MSSPNQNNSKPILVTKAIIPPLEEYQAQLRDIWDNRQFTNAGPKHAELKKALCDFLGVPDCVLVGNGTYALVDMVAAFGLEPGEVITTPFTFVASAHCLEPLKLTPRFVDIKADGLTIDPAEIEKAITPKTRAILGVHVYGNPCDIEAIDKIAKKYNIKVIYDAAHAFGVTYKGQSIFNYGDASCVSFHATKAFHTFEGGAVFSNNPDICEFVGKYKNFGMNSLGIFERHGLNTKMSELHAAAGLVNLPHYHEHVMKKKVLYDRYQRELADVKDLSFVSMKDQENPNYNYCPVLFGRGRDALFDRFKEDNIFTRKYFYPLLTDMPAYTEYKQTFPVASKVAEQILCLPIYSDMTEEEHDKVIQVIKNF